MKSRTERLVEVAALALDVAKDAYNVALASRERARDDVDRANAVVARSREGRDREVARGVTESTFAALDAWMLVAKKSVVDAELALARSERVVAEARERVEQGLSRVRQMEKLQERMQKEAHAKEGKRELRAEDEALARRATTR